MTAEILRAEIMTFTPANGFLWDCVTTAASDMEFYNVTAPVRFDMADYSREEWPANFSLKRCPNGRWTAEAGSNRSGYGCWAANAKEAVEGLGKAHREFLGGRGMQRGQRTTGPFTSDLGKLLATAEELNQSVADAVQEVEASEDHLVLDHRSGKLVAIFLARFPEHFARGLIPGRWYCKPAHESFETWTYPCVRSYPDFATALKAFGPTTIGSLRNG